MRSDDVHHAAVATVVSLLGPRFRTRDVVEHPLLRAAHAEQGRDADYRATLARYLAEHAAELGVQPAGPGQRWTHVPVPPATPAAPSAAAPSAPARPEPPAARPPRRRRTWLDRLLGRRRGSEPDEAESRRSRRTLGRSGLRAQYRQLAAADPALARSMGVGRPDLDRPFDDGGLLDLNAMPAAALVRHAGLSTEQAEQVVALRGRFARLYSVDELLVHLPLAPPVVARLRERAVFL